MIIKYYNRDCQGTGTLCRDILTYEGTWRVWEIAWRPEWLGHTELGEKLPER